MTKIRVTQKGSGWKLASLLVLGLGLFIAALLVVSIDFQKFFVRLENVPVVLRRMMALDLSILPDIFMNIGTSLALAFVALAAAIVVSLVFSLLAAHTIAPNQFLAQGIKSFFAIIRAIPSLVLGLMIIASLGFGNTAGLLIIFISSTAYLVKMFVGSIEDVGSEIVEAMNATGASWWNVVFHGVLPLAVTGLVSWIALRFEGNIEESISLGVIGVGGVGLLLTQAINAYNYAQTTTIVLVICLLLISIEVVLTKLKQRIRLG